MNPNPLGGAVRAVTRGLALAFVGLFTTTSPMAVIGGLVILVAMLAAVVLLVMWRFGRMTKSQRIDVIELVRALRQSGK